MLYLCEYRHPTHPKTEISEHGGACEGAYIVPPLPTQRRPSNTPLKGPIIPRTSELLRRLIIFLRLIEPSVLAINYTTFRARTPLDGLRRIRLTRIPSGKLLRYVHLRTAVTTQSRRHRRPKKPVN